LRRFEGFWTNPGILGKFQPIRLPRWARPGWGNPENFLGNFALDLLVFWDSTPEERHFAGFLVGVPWSRSVDLASGLSVLRLGPGWEILRDQAKARCENLSVCGGDLGFWPSVGLGSQALGLFPLEGVPPISLDPHPRLRI